MAALGNRFRNRHMHAEYIRQSNGAHRRLIKISVSSELPVARCATGDTENTISPLNA